MYETNQRDREEGGSTHNVNTMTHKKSRPPTHKNELVSTKSKDNRTIMTMSSLSKLAKPTNVRVSIATKDDYRFSSSPKLDYSPEFLRSRLPYKIPLPDG